jgi:hypothetical protein
VIKAPQSNTLIFIQALSMVKHLALAHGIWRADQPDYRLAVPT